MTDAQPRYPRPRGRAPTTSAVPHPIPLRGGSLDEGKDADLVLWLNDPVGTWAEAQIVVVGGRVVFRR